MSKQPPTQSGLQQAIHQLVATHRRAILRALMPAIDSAVSQGVTYAELSRRLEAAGVTLAPESIRKARQRWRSRKHERNEQPCVAPGTPALTAPSTNAPPVMRSGGIHSKADLVRLRTSSESIDLTQLAEIGRHK